ISKEQSKGKESSLLNYSHKFNRELDSNQENRPKSRTTTSKQQTENIMIEDTS
ncbi:4695_t:CDS:1, partial [Dentiscutata heterogama]